MHRYRKGQIFRPPTAMESAAIADAVGAFQVRPPRPQDKTPVGQTVIVKTHTDGIPARDGDDISFAMCKRVIQKNATDGKEFAQTDEQVIVFNITKVPIPGDVYMATALTECGVRYVVPLDGKVLGKLDEALEQGGSATVSIWGGEGGSESDTGVNITVFDWLMKSGASDIAAGKKVIVSWINGVAYVTECECP